MSSFFTRNILSVCFLILICSSGLFAQDWAPIPPPSEKHPSTAGTMLTLSDGRVFLFAGKDDQEDLFNDLYEFESNKWNNIVPLNAPPALSHGVAGHSMNLMPDGETVIIFGGEYGDSYSNEVYKFYVDKRFFVEIEVSGQKPPGRAYHNAFMRGNDLYVIGGRNESGPLHDFWVFNTDRKVWRQEPDASHDLEKSCMYSNGDYLSVFRADGSYKYDFDRSIWTTLEYGEEYRTNTTQARIGKDVYFCGGKVYNGGMIAGNPILKTGAEYTNEVLVLDTLTYQITTTTALPVTLADAAVAAFFDSTDNREKIVLVGGKINDDSLNAQCFVFDPEGKSSVDDQASPDDLLLLQNYPNPFSTNTVISFEVKNSGRISLKIYDTFGREVESLIDKYYLPGKYNVKFTSDDLPAGIYFYKVQSKDTHRIKSMLKLQ